MTPSSVINFIEKNDFHMKVTVIDFNLIKSIRSYLRFIYSELFEHSADSPIAARLRLELLKLQSSPILPGPEILTECSLDDNDKVRRVFGETIAKACHNLEVMLQSIEGKDSPLIIELLESVKNNLTEDDLSQIKIWCHKGDKKHFVNAFISAGIELLDTNFIHSLAEYRKTSGFETLIKIGPLRNSGWGRTPNVIMTAPRYRKIIRILWSGMNDEVEYTYDKLIGSNQTQVIFSLQDRKEVIINSEVGNLDFELPRETEEDVDDINFLSLHPLHVKKETNSILVELPNETGVLFRPGSRRLVLDFEGDTPISIKKISEVNIGDYLIFPSIHADFGDEKIELEKTKWAKIWKKELKKKFEEDKGALFKIMRKAGINLKYLEIAVARWTSMEGQVITGPQSSDHFRLLIENVLTGCLRPKSWRRAWKEIQESNVKAMQNGMLENEIANEQLINDLKPHMNRIKSYFDKNEHFNFILMDSESLFGVIKFSQVFNISSGFRCPNEKLDSVEHLAEVEACRNNVQDIQ